MGWKMVRDKQREWCEENGVSGSWRKATLGEAFHALARKLIEEGTEYGEEYDLGELHDLEDVISELKAIAGAEACVKAAAAHHKKVKLMGTFSTHLMWSPVPGEGEE